MGSRSLFSSFSCNFRFWTHHVFYFIGNFFILLFCFATMSVFLLVFFVRNILMSVQCSFDIVWVTLKDSDAWKRGSVLSSVYPTQTQNTRAALTEASVSINDLSSFLFRYKPQKNLWRQLWKDWKCCCAIPKLVDLPLELSVPQTTPRQLFLKSDF